jgi:hypothetical protein
MIALPEVPAPASAHAPVAAPERDDTLTRVVAPLSAEQAHLVNCDPPPARRMAAAHVERLIAACNALTAALAPDEEQAPWESPTALQEFRQVWVDSLYRLPGVDDMRSWRLELRFPYAVTEREETVQGPFRAKTLTVEEWPSCVAIGLIDGSALVLPQGSHTWHRVTRRCHRCGELAITPPSRAELRAHPAPFGRRLPACSIECATGVVSAAARDRIRDRLSACLDALGGCANDARGVAPGWDKFGQYGDVLALPGIDLRETGRRQQQYGTGVLVYALADGSEFTRGIGQEWRWSAHPRDAAISPLPNRIAAAFRTS